MKHQHYGSATATLALLMLVLGVAIVVGSSPVFGQRAAPTPTPITIRQSGWLEGKTIDDRRVDLYQFYGRAGQYVTIQMEAYDSRSSIDPWLDLKDTYGTIVISDDDSAGGSNSLIDGYRLQKTGYYTIMARSYRDQTYGRYWLYWSLSS